MFVTQHAAAQYVQRIRPDMSRECARAHLIREVVRPESTGERTEVGHPIWRISDALLITKNDPTYGQIVVTVLAPEMPSAWRETLAEAEDEIVAAARRVGAGMPARDNVDGRTSRMRKRARLSGRRARR